MTTISTTVKRAVQAIGSSPSVHPICVLVIGPPGSGKSSFARQLETSGFQFDHVSSDFSDAHYVEKRMAYMMRKFREALGYRRNVLVDQTNISAAKRRGYITEAAHRDYKLIAVDLFSLPTSELIKRCQEREQVDHRHIPTDVIIELANKYEPPSYAEGFDIIYKVQQ